MPWHEERQKKVLEGNTVEHDLIDRDIYFSALSSGRLAARFGSFFCWLGRRGGCLEHLHTDSLLNPAAMFLADRIIMALQRLLLRNLGHKSLQLLQFRPMPEPIVAPFPAKSS